MKALKKSKIFKKFEECFNLANAPRSIIRLIKPIKCEPNLNTYKKHIKQTSFIQIFNVSSYKKHSLLYFIYFSCTHRLQNDQINEKSNKT